MRFLTVALLICVSLWGATEGWLHDYDEALREAKKQNKGVYLFVGADECRWCDRFKELTLSKKEAINRLQEEYVLLYLSRDRHKIPEHFEVRGVPRHYFLTSGGEIIHADRGSREIDGFLNLIEEVNLKK